jgi:hypothetical protein
MSTQERIKHLERAIAALAKAGKTAELIEFYLGRLASK